MDDWYMQESIAPEGDTSAKKSFSVFREIIQLVLIVVLVRVGMDTFLPRYVVEGASMEPNFHTSERVIVDRFSMLLSGPARGARFHAGELRLSRFNLEGSDSNAPIHTHSRSRDRDVIAGG